jgi:hypothetical protein
MIENGQIIMTNHPAAVEEIKEENSYHESDDDNDEIKEDNNRRIKEDTHRQ